MRHKQIVMMARKALALQDARIAGMVVNALAAVREDIKEFRDALRKKIASLGYETSVAASNQSLSHYLYVKWPFNWNAGDMKDFIFMIRISDHSLPEKYLTSFTGNIDIDLRDRDEKRNELAIIKFFKQIRLSNPPETVDDMIAVIQEWRGIHVGGSGKTKKELKMTLEAIIFILQRHVDDVTGETRRREMRKEQEKELSRQEFHARVNEFVSWIKTTPRARDVFAQVNERMKTGLNKHERGALNNFIKNELGGDIFDEYKTIVKGYGRGFFKEVIRPIYE